MTRGAGEFLGQLAQLAGAKGLLHSPRSQAGEAWRGPTLLRDTHAGVEQEPLTSPWFGVRYSETTFGIFEAFPDADACQRSRCRNFLRSGLLHDMLARPAHSIAKFNVMFGETRRWAFYSS